MPAPNAIKQIFSILHDGTISAWEGDSDLLTLTVDCAYLAERIDQSFDKFYVQLIKVERLELAPWTNPIDLPAIVKTDYAEIFKAALEILSADIKDGLVVVSCEQHNRDYDYSGGNLTISAEAVKVFDQHKNELTIAQFAEICKNYWNEWSER